MKDITKTSDNLLPRYLKLIEISRELSSTLDLKSLLQSIVEAAASLTESQSASILLYDEAQNELYFEATTDVNSPLLIGLDIPVNGSIAGEIVTTRKPLLVSNTQDNPKHFKPENENIIFNTENLVGVPLITQDTVVGVLESINKISGDFNNDDIEILTALGSQAAVAIVNARLFQQSDLIAEMIHELRTPLASINTASHLLSRPELSTTQRVSMAETIQKETNRLSEMATTFLDLARLESGRVQYHQKTIHLKRLLEESAEIMGSRIEQQNLSLEWQLEEFIPIFNADEDKLKQVILNLISNAIKYNVPNGKIIIGAGYDEDTQTIFFSVRDTGRGMHKDHIESLFDKFYRVPGSEQYAQGTGLGLAISQKIINAHNGDILVESEFGKGTLFSVTLPFKND